MRSAWSSRVSIASTTGQAGQRRAFARLGSGHAALLRSDPVRLPSGTGDMVGTCPFRSVSVGFRAACAGGRRCPRLRPTPCSTARRPERLRAWTRSSRSPSFASMPTASRPERSRGSFAPRARSRQRPRRFTASATRTSPRRRASPRSLPSCSSSLAGAVFVAHNARFDLAMLQHAFRAAGIEYRPAAVACTLDAFRLLEPLAPDHRLESICERRGISLVHAHDAPSDVSATAALLRLLLDEGIAPETVELDLEAFMRLRSRGDTRPATAAQIRRVFALGYAAGLSTGGHPRARRPGCEHRRRRRADPRTGPRRLRRARAKPHETSDAPTPPACAQPAGRTRRDGRSGEAAARRPARPHRLRRRR